MFYMAQSESRAGAGASNSSPRLAFAKVREERKMRRPKTPSNADRLVLHALRDPEQFSRHILGRPLYPYQAEVIHAIVNSVVRRQGHVFSVMFARQMGKNELSAHLEAYLLNLFQRAGGTIVKAAPTFTPQALISKARLEGLLDNPFNRRRWRRQWEHTVRLGRARVLFLSGEPHANVVGATADLLLEIDEAQDFDADKYRRDFRPMASTTNATTVLYGTAWREDDQLWQTRRHNLEAEQRDGVRRHFEYDWRTLAAIQPAYDRFVRAERERLGEDHPLFVTQYALRPLAGAGRLFSPAHLAQMAGAHARRGLPGEEVRLVAGLDLAGAGMGEHDESVLTIAGVEMRPVAGIYQPTLLILDHFAWRGEDLTQLSAQIADLLTRTWPAERVVVDATGLGAGVASFLAAALGAGRVEPFIFSAPAKSWLGYELLAAVGGGRVRMYADDGSPEYGAFWEQARACRREIGAGQLLRFYVPPDEGHDDYVISLALCVRAAGQIGGAPAAAWIEAPDILNADVGRDTMNTDETEEAM